MDGMADQAPETFPVTLAGREILFHKVTGGQIAILQRITHKIRAELHTATTREQEEAAYNRLIQASFDVIESRFVNPEDRDWVEKEMLAGNIDEKAIRVVLANGNPVTDASDDDADVAPKRPGRKQPAKKPAAKTANTRRVTR